MLLDFWLILLPFISFYTIFRKAYILFSNDYILVNTIYKCCYLFFGWEIGHPLTRYDMEKITVPGKLKRWKKNLLHFPKEKINSLEMNGGEGDFSVENLGLFFRSSGNVKQDIITRNWTYKFPHKFPNNLGLIVLGNVKLLRLFIWLLISWTNND